MNIHSVLCFKLVFIVGHLKHWRLVLTINLNNPLLFINHYYSCCVYFCFD